eukprot:CAMPEP_0206043038 /NCGR_PEP_ID=MMETSP1466-20131121/7494_1 /ASSEMBLY_ACC=CAM_ASM_001126 /TAXON_ID=44452 /ORGANISM="Pavlova gyrans, Strain CCMP608" /LENGTH=46 /DNA_ID= /DNA_START= /DNA_END= /DNA_ORIENTATION=
MSLGRERSKPGDSAYKRGHPCDGVRDDVAFLFLRRAEEIDEHHLHV